MLAQPRRRHNTWNESGFATWPTFELDRELACAIYGEGTADEMFKEPRTVELALGINNYMIGVALLSGSVVRGKSHMRLKYSVEVQRFKGEEVEVTVGGSYCHIGNPILRVLLLCCSRGAAKGLPIGKLAGLQSSVIREIFSYVSADLPSTLLDLDSVSTMKVGWVDAWPPPQGLNVNMMPFEVGNVHSLPARLHGYWDVLERMDSRLTYNNGRRHETMPKIAYLTIDERGVPKGRSQRRPGLHTETPGVKVGGIGPAYGFDYHPWGMGWVECREAVGGIYMASSVGGSTRMYDVEVREGKVGKVGEGDVGWLR